MTFSDFLASDEAFAAKHEGEYAYAVAAWNAAIEAAAARCDEELGPDLRGVAVAIRRLHE